MSRTRPHSRVPLSVTTPDLRFPWPQGTLIEELPEIVFKGPCTVELYSSINQTVIDKGARGGGPR
jgi:hypothetical protein